MWLRNRRSYVYSLCTRHPFQDQPIEPILLINLGEHHGLSEGANLHHLGLSPTQQPSKLQAFLACPIAYVRAHLKSQKYAHRCMSKGPENGNYPSLQLKDLPPSASSLSPSSVYKPWSELQNLRAFSPSVVSSLSHRKALKVTRSLNPYFAPQPQKESHIWLVHTAHNIYMLVNGLNERRALESR